jgi:predicted NUDIX family NTP pyrophosphohydrolase
VRTSAGILLYRQGSGLEVLIGHMGGPFWAKKDDGAWSIPKGEYGPDEDAFAVAGDVDPAAVVPGTFLLEWPPRSGRMQEVPEVDRVEWVDLETAAVKLVMGQVPFLQRLVDAVGAG